MHKNTHVVFQSGGGNKVTLGLYGAKMTGFLSCGVCLQLQLAQGSRAVPHDAKEDEDEGENKITGSPWGGVQLERTHPL